MIRLLLFGVVISPSLLTAAPQPCPADAACLYHFKCLGDRSIPVDATVDGTRFNEWKKEKCNKHNAAITELQIRPLTNHKWEILLAYPNAGVTIEFDNNGWNNLFTIMVDTDKKHPAYIEPIDTGDTYSFTADVLDVHPYELFKDSKIVFIDGDDVTTSQQLEFWKRILELTKCDASLIVDEVKSESTTLVQDEKKIECTAGKLWIYLADKEWHPLKTLTCGPNKEWAALDENEAPVANEGKLNVQCALEKPALPPSTTSTTTTTSTTSTTTSTTTTTTTTTTTAPSAANTTTTTESSEPTTSPASRILPSLIIPIVISGLHLIQ